MTGTHHDNMCINVQVASHKWTDCAIGVAYNYMPSPRASGDRRYACSGRRAERGGAPVVGHGWTNRQYLFMCVSFGMPASIHTANAMHILMILLCEPSVLVEVSFPRRVLFRIASVNTSQHGMVCTIHNQSGLVYNCHEPCVYEMDAH